MMLDILGIGQPKQLECNKYCCVCNNKIVGTPPITYFTSGGASTKEQYFCSGECHRSRFRDPAPTLVQPIVKKEPASDKPKRIPYPEDVVFLQKQLQALKILVVKTHNLFEEMESVKYKMFVHDVSFSSMRIGSYWMTLSARENSGFPHVFCWNASGVDKESDPNFVADYSNAYFDYIDAMFELNKLEKFLRSGKVVRYK